MCHEARRIRITRSASLNALPLPAPNASHTSLPSPLLPCTISTRRRSHFLPLFPVVLPAAAKRLPAKRSRTACISGTTTPAAWRQVPLRCWNERGPEDTAPAQAAASEPLPHTGMPADAAGMSTAPPPVSEAALCATLATWRKGTFALLVSALRSLAL